MRHKIFVVIAIWCLATVSTLQAQAQFSITALMGPGDQRAVGIANLSPGEQQALEMWINLWTMKTIEHVLAQRCKCTADECLESLYQEVSGGAPLERPRRNSDKVERTGGGYQPSYDQQNNDDGASDNRSNSQSSKNYSGGSRVDQVEQQSYLLISNVQRNGGLIQLEDGSVWEVSPPDQVTAGHWHRRDKVQLVPGTQYGDYTLYNLTTSQQVRVMHPGQALRLDPFLGDTYRKAITKNVRENLNNGATIILDDGSSFEIRLSDRSSITSQWGPGTIVQVTKKGGMYPYSLKSAQNGDTAEARLK